MNELPRSTRFDWLSGPGSADEQLPGSAQARLAELPRIERFALALSGIGGLNADEIAQRLGTEPAIVRRLLDRARTSVRHSP